MLEGLRDGTSEEVLKSSIAHWVCNGIDIQATTTTKCHVSCKIYLHWM